MLYSSPGEDDTGSINMYLHYCAWWSVEGDMSIYEAFRGTGQGVGWTSLLEKTMDGLSYLGLNRLFSYNALRQGLARKQLFNFFLG